VHGIETFLRSPKPSTTIPTLETIETPCGQQEDHPCANCECEMFHTIYFSEGSQSTFYADES
jgi:hypothetical protein